MNNLENELREAVDQKIDKLMIVHQQALSWERRDVGRQRIPYPQAMQGDFQNFVPPGEWGGFDETVWFKTSLKIPEHFKGFKARVSVNTGGEGLAYVDGKPLQGLDFNRHDLELVKKVDGASQFFIALEVFSTPGLGGPFGRKNPQGLDDKRKFAYSFLEAIDEEIEAFHKKTVAFFGLVLSWEKEKEKNQGMQDLLNEITPLLEFKEYAPPLVDKIRKCDQRLEKRFPVQVKSKQKLWLVGHAHIDNVWLWPERETIRKCGRTHATALKYMQDYPYYHFVMSQAQQYDYHQQHYPELYKQIKTRVQEGRWEPLGCMWVETDCNLTAGESIIRQALYGRKFFLKEFGLRSTVAFLPDTFGFNAQLPQLLRGCGFDYFVTTKISWNESNKFPYQYFRWQGIDGTQIPTYFAGRTYNLSVDARSLLKHLDYFKQKDIPILGFYGIGDGGGGPRRAWIENIKLQSERPGLPALTTGTVEDFFKELSKIRPVKRWPVYQGELYLELHRGTYTTQALMKKNNRKSEQMLRNLETLSTLASLRGYAYPMDTIEGLWRTVLKNQFHDALPGSSINEVYKDCHAEYKQVFEAGNQLTEKAAGALTSATISKSPQNYYLVFNSLSWARTDLVEIEIEEKKSHSRFIGKNGETLGRQILEKKDGRVRYLVEVKDVPGCGYQIIQRVSGDPPGEQNPAMGTVSKERLENQFFSLEFYTNGVITRLKDKLRKRDVFEKGKAGNVFHMLKDAPWNWDAWDIDLDAMENYREFGGTTFFFVKENGPLRQVLGISRYTSNVSIEQDIMLYRHVPRIDFATKIGWAESQRMLKVAFPVNVKTQSATYDIAYGNFRRPNHRNNSIAKAKFEVPAHKWADLSDAGYGVSLLNDCKYGYDVKGSLMRLSLLRSPKWPDPQADMGDHYLKYSLFPHAGNCYQGGTIRAGYELNYPFLIFPLASKPEKEEESFFNVANPNVILETVKLSEEGKHVVLRLYECWNRKTECQLDWNFPVRAVQETNFVEERKQILKTNGKSIKFKINPFEIKTFLLEK